MSTAIIHPAQPEQILKALTKVWTSVGQEQKQQGKPTVLRASSMTLIVATDEQDGGFSASQTIADLMQSHPSRGIVLAVSEKAERDLEARVLAQCWKPFGKAEQICCEQIEITSAPASWPNIGPTVIGIIPADLPVILWCRHRAALKPSAGPDQKAGLEAVMNLSSKVIVDSKDEDPSGALGILGEWRARGRVVADLEWTRLTRWREPIAHLFDNPAAGNGLSNFNAIEIAYTGEKPSSSVLYMAGWLSAPYRANVLVINTKGPAPGLKRIRMRSKSEMIELDRTSCDCMTLRSSNGRERQYSFNEASLYTLLNEELSILGPDPAFDLAFTRAQEFVF
ncbi:MAG: glucose-6-phosphate dehydrogenase assembly protein OpcA [Acidobacteriaceae bacterium]|nr:glucose-6-phosphate dehydrogenase assembly protein OpcA [Acidobacteriaceae bacterium]MBV9780870.1 glucose-6-phosphate dehydrogenase assembly protein OpcA [Acidobacteriaceae bacterium]